MFRLACRALLVVAILAAMPAKAQMPELLATGIESLAKQISAQVDPQQPKRTLAIFPLRMQDGSQTLFGRYFADELRIHIANLRVLTVVERDPESLERLLEEMEIGKSSGYFDPSTTREVGRLTGADTIATGTVTDLNSMVAVNVRLIDTQSGSMLGGALVKVVKDDDVKAIFPGSASTRVERERVQAGTPAPPADQAAVDELESDGFKLRLIGCKPMSGGIRCNFWISSVGRDIQLGRLDGRAIDAGGMEAELSDFTIGGERKWAVLPADVPLRLEVTFRGGGGRLRVQVGGAAQQVVYDRNLKLMEIILNHEAHFRFRDIQMVD